MCNMWEKLPKDQKEKYKKLIVNFASLSEAFAQKADDQESVVPIVNSKFQEAAFQRAFNATAEDIANSSYDASIKSDDGKAYLVGIKSFGIGSGDQKIAQFKAQSVEWIQDIKELQNMKGKDISEISFANSAIYMRLAKMISNLRNERIRSSREQLRGFRVKLFNPEEVYHVLMPSKKGEPLQIHVGETSYNEIDINKLKVLGPTSSNTPSNFRFTDDKHIYKYTSADSQLYMTFNNRDIVVESWDISYIDDALSFFENLTNSTLIKEENKHYESYSWPIIVQPFSGFNAFYGGSKLPKPNRKQRILQIQELYQSQIDPKGLNQVIKYLKEILLTTRQTDDEKKKMILVRSNLLDLVKSFQNDKLISDITKLVFRPVSEMYIPIPEARQFHANHPQFFGDNIARLKAGESSLELPKEERRFTLKLLPSGDELSAYICQDSGKGIQSYNEQGILGEWILRKVFQLQEYEPLTQTKLNELGINGLRFTKLDEGIIGLEFIWSDDYVDIKE